MPRLASCRAAESSGHPAARLVPLIRGRRPTASIRASRGLRRACTQLSCTEPDRTAAERGGGGVSAQLNPYLSFRDNAREAMEFYQSVFGGELASNTFAEFQASDDPAEQDKIMHSMLTTDGSMVLMASDTPQQMDYAPGNSCSLSLSGEDEGELRGYWERLSVGGNVTMP